MMAAQRDTHFPIGLIKSPRTRSLPKRNTNVGDEAGGNNPPVPLVLFFLFEELSKREWGRDPPQDHLNQIIPNRCRASGLHSFAGISCSKFNYKQ
ncbi:hypothetical protein MTP99_010431 [Tenebrio molitor]|nr:hypothetical protein MTP99_010431 [Tenebrio molitor]